MELQNIKTKLYKKIFNYLQQYLINKDYDFILDKCNNITNEWSINNFSKKEWGNIHNIKISMPN